MGPEYYGFKRHGYQQLYKDLGMKDIENAVGIIAKNRNGGLGDIGMHYVENKTKYVNPGD
jgi:replicative DNA helicase